MSKSLLAATVLLIPATLAQAAPVYSSTVHVGYDPSSPSNNTPQTAVKNSSSTSYDVKFGSDGVNIYVEVVATNPPAVFSGNDFSNIYIGGVAFSGLGIEVTNDRAFIPGVSGYTSLAGTGFTFTDNPGDIAFSLPLSFLEDDPLNMGFSKVHVGDQLRISYSQSFGYTFVGGSTYYDPVARLGALIVPAAPTPTPEPVSWALLAAGLAGLTVLRRRYS